MFHSRQYWLLEGVRGEVVSTNLMAAAKASAVGTVNSAECRRLSEVDEQPPIDPPLSEKTRKEAAVPLATETGGHAGSS